MTNTQNDIAAITAMVSLNDTKIFLDSGLLTRQMKEHGLSGNLRSLLTELVSLGLGGRLIDLYVQGEGQFSATADAAGSSASTVLKEICLKRLRWSQADFLSLAAAFGVFVEISEDAAEVLGDDAQGATTSNQLEGDWDSPVAAAFAAASANVATDNVTAANVAAAAADKEASAGAGANLFDSFKQAFGVSPRIGAVGAFGTDTSRGNQALRWRVIGITEDAILVLSEQPIMRSAYNSYNSDVTWETSTLRKTLNEGLLNVAFTEEERQQMKRVLLHTPGNKATFTPGGRDTEDVLFCLSEDEVINYLTSSDHSRTGRVASMDGKRCTWVLRTPGANQSMVQFVTEYGELYQEGTYVYAEIPIRPAFWFAPC
jgi:hypothetical protein